jgi:hypothetical protein
MSGHFPVHSEPDDISQQGPVHHRNFEELHIVHDTISTLSTAPPRNDTVAPVPVPPWHSAGVPVQVDHIMWLWLI